MARVILWLTILAVLARAAGPAASPMPLSSDEILWQQITVLQEKPPATQPFAPWFSVAERRLSALRGQVHLYLTLYPGGPHRDDAIRIELATLFELGTLRGGDLAALQARVTELLRAPPSPAAEQEAAYWDILCQRGPARPGTPTSQATTAPVDPLPASLLPAYRQYLSRYPRSPHVLRLARVLFDDAVRRHDREAMRAVVERVGTNFPNDAITEALLGTWNRLENVGRPFALSFRMPDGVACDTRSYLGHEVLVVVWASHDAAARDCVAQIEAYRAAHPELRVVGVNLDEDRTATQAAVGALGIDWPQLNDRRGWGTEFVRTWNVTRMPFVFVIDPAGVLLGAAAGCDWQALLPPSPTPGP
jgi:hypothetical protein